MRDPGYCCIPRAYVIHSVGGYVSEIETGFDLDMGAVAYHWQVNRSDNWGADSHSWGGGLGVDEHWHGEWDVHSGGPTWETAGVVPARNVLLERPPTKHPGRGAVLTDLPAESVGFEPTVTSLPRRFYRLSARASSLPHRRVPRPSRWRAAAPSSGGPTRRPNQPPDTGAAGRVREVV